MKRKNKVIILLVLPIFLELIVSCCNCDDVDRATYTNCNVSLQNLDNSGHNIVVSDENTISAKAYGIRVSVDQKEQTCYQDTPKSLFFPSAMAYTCDCGPMLQYSALETITKITVTSVNDFDEGHLKDSDVSEYFQVFQDNMGYTIEDFVHEIPSELYDVIEPSLEFDLLLMTPPAESAGHQFKVVIELSDDRVLEAVTEIVELTL